VVAILMLRVYRRGGDGSLSDVFPPELDSDGDGLTALEEILRLTSDHSLDSDSDGVPDPDDRCIECRAESFRDRLESLLAEEIVRDWGSTRETVFVVPIESVDPRPACPEVTFVSAPDWAAEFLFRQPEAWRTEERPAFAVLRLEPRVYVPGLIYVYYVEYFCGPLCAEWSFAFLVDVPLFDPVYAGRKVVGVS
jgi:hypothetical protein